MPVFSDFNWPVLAFFVNLVQNCFGDFFHRSDGTWNTVLRHFRLNWFVAGHLASRSTTYDYILPQPETENVSEDVKENSNCIFSPYGYLRHMAKIQVDFCVPELKQHLGPFSTKARCNCFVFDRKFSKKQMRSESGISTKPHWQFWSNPFSVPCESTWSLLAKLPRKHVFTTLDSWMERKGCYSFACPIGKQWINLGNKRRLKPTPWKSFKRPAKMSFQTNPKTKLHAILYKNSHLSHEEGLL